MSQFAPLLFCSLLNMHDLRFKDKEYLAPISTYISIIVLIFVSAVLFLLFLMVWRKTKILNKEQVMDFSRDYSVLLDSLK
jgi:hypothetical protein